MKKKIVIIVICILIGAVLTSTISGNSVLNYEENDVYIDPDIRLTRFHLPLLRSTIGKYNTEQYDFLLNEIVEGIKKDGLVDNKDLSEIIEDINPLIKDIYFSCYINIYTLNGGMILPFWINIIGPILVEIKLPYLYILYDGNNDDYNHIEINDDRLYENGESAFIIGFFGRTGTGQIPCGDDFISIEGNCLMMIVS